MAVVVPDQIFAELTLGGQSLRVVGYLPWHEGRSKVERFIAARFQKAHGALIQAFLPTLVSLESDRGKIHAAIGVRCAQTEKLFLEQYLSQPIEEAISNHGRVLCSRRDVIEVGNLAGGQRGISRYFFAILTAVLQKWGARWLACTGTREVSNVFSRLGISPIEVSAAHADSLPNGDAGWGTYYDHQPVVMIGDIAAGFKRIEQTGFLRRCGYQAVEANDVLIA